MADAALAAELTELRRRGLADIDLQTRTQARVTLPRLEELARRYTGDNASRRTEVIRHLLHDALQAYHQAGYELEAELIGGLFFDDGRGETLGRRPAGERLAAALQASGLGEDSFKAKRKAMFLDFAGYLITFGDAREAPQPEQLASRRTKLILLAVAALALVVVAAIIWLERSDDATSLTGSQPSNSSPGSPTASTTGPSGTSPAVAATLTFDDLGGGLPTIHVFPGIKDTPRDKIPNGTYRHGDKVPALCTAKGRLVTSDTTVGERPRHSDVWVRIGGSSGAEQYAPLTYASVPATSLQALPSCPQ